MRMVSKLGKKMSRRHERLEIFTPRTTAHRVASLAALFFGGGVCFFGSPAWNAIAQKMLVPLLQEMKFEQIEAASFQMSRMPSIHRQLRMPQIDHL